MMIFDDARLIKMLDNNVAMLSARPPREHVNSPMPTMIAYERPSPCILVADDDAPIVELLRDVLEDAGLIVVWAYDGEQAWELVRRVRPDLVISDVTMPRLNGVELLQRLQSSRDLGCIPIILMSAVAQPRLADRVAFLSKPFDIERMLSLVAAHLAAA